MLLFPPQRWALNSPVLCNKRCIKYVTKKKHAHLILFMYLIIYCIKYILSYVRLYRVYIIFRMSTHCENPLLILHSCNSNSKSLHLSKLWMPTIWSSMHLLFPCSSGNPHIYIYCTLLIKTFCYSLYQWQCALWDVGQWLRMHLFSLLKQDYSVPVTIQV